MKQSSSSAPVRRRPPLLAIFLGCVMLLFIAILVFTFVEAKNANPVILDEKGAPR